MPSNPSCAVGSTPVALTALLSAHEPTLARSSTHRLGARRGRHDRGVRRWLRRLAAESSAGERAVVIARARDDEPEVIRERAQSVARRGVLVRMVDLETH